LADEIIIGRVGRMVFSIAESGEIGKRVVSGKRGGGKMIQPALISPAAERIPVPANERKFMKRKASAVWRGDLKTGKGSISTESGVLKETQYSFGTRFENGVGTNPEELIGAAHAGCFSMAFSAELGKAGLTPESIHTTAIITLDKTDAGFTVTESHLDMTAKIPGADKEKILAIANAAKAGCPISRVLNAKVTLDAKFEV
jgi:osmotically inducible protein OsmC